MNGESFNKKGSKKKEKTSESDLEENEDHIIQLPEVKDIKRIKSILHKNELLEDTATRD